MKKLFVVSDVHSFYDELRRALTEAGFDKNNPDHIFISCGDLLDRGPKANQCLDFVNNLPEDRKILIQGNHEDLLEDIIYVKKRFESYDYSNGTVNSMEQISGITLPSFDTDFYLYQGCANAIIEDCKNNEQLNKYLDTCIDYFEIKDHIFVHGWIPSSYEHTKLSDYTRKPLPDWREVLAHSNIWKDARWVNGMSVWNEGVVEKDKTIVCGHWHSNWGHVHLHHDGKGLSYYETNPDEVKVDIFIDKGIVALDACTALSKIVNCYTIEVEDEEWQSKI